MEITPGYWRQRDGGRAKVAEIDGKAISYAVGWDSDGRACGWTKDGLVGHECGPTERMLVEPWVDKPLWPTWPVPPWINWIAVNGHGNWFGYSTRPEPYGSIWVFSQPTASIEIPAAYKPIWTGDWTKSLIERPKQS